MTCSQARAAEASTSGLPTNVVQVVMFPPLGERWGASAMFLIFAAVSALSLVFCYRRVPETKGVSLDQITAAAESRRAAQCSTS